MKACVIWRILQFAWTIVKKRILCKQCQSGPKLSNNHRELQLGNGTVGGVGTLQR